MHTQSPDGETIVSAGADETLRFWPIFGPGGGAGKGAKGQSPSRSPAGGRKRAYDGGDGGPCPSPLAGSALSLR